jgi:hypothetical protein
MSVGWNARTMTPTIEAIGELQIAWSWLLPERYQPVLFSALGDMFYQTQSGEIWWLNTGTTEISKVAESQPGISASSWYERGGRLVSPTID